MRLLAIALLASLALAQEPPFDLLITGGRIVDGSGNAWYRAEYANFDAEKKRNSMKPPHLPLLNSLKMPLRSRKGRNSASGDLFPETNRFQR